MNLGINLMHLQPRDELERLRRPSLFHPRPAGNSQNEQYARAQLHARNEADIGEGPGGAANEPDEESADGRLDTHWTRILHYDLFDANIDRPAAGAEGANVAAPRAASGRTAVIGGFSAAVSRLRRALGWVHARH